MKQDSSPCESMSILWYNLMICLPNVMCFHLKRHILCIQYVLRLNIVVETTCHDLSNNYKCFDVWQIISREVRDFQLLLPESTSCSQSIVQQLIREGNMRRRFLKASPIGLKAKKKLISLMSFLRVKETQGAKYVFPSICTGKVVEVMFPFGATEV